MRETKEIAGPATGRQLTASRLLVTLLAGFTAGSPFVADFNRTHVYNPYWPGHARFHNGQTMTFGLLSGLLALYFLWGRKTASPVANWQVACLLTAQYWLALVPAIFYPGATLTDPQYNGRPLDAFFGIVVSQWPMGLVLLLAIGGCYWVEVKRLRTAGLG